MTTKPTVVRDPATQASRGQRAERTKRFEMAIHRGEGRADVSAARCYVRLLAISYSGTCSRIRHRLIGRWTGEIESECRYIA